MKKHIITLFLIFASVVNLHAAITYEHNLNTRQGIQYDMTENNLNTYAFGLESVLSEDASILNVTYRLNNSNATSVNVLVYNGEEVVATVAGGTTIGKNTVALATANLPKGVRLTWGVEVNGTSVEVPTQEAKTYSFYHPSGLDIDNNPENATFGMLLINECLHHVKDIAEGYVSSNYGAGIYAFAPSFDPIPNGNQPGYNGGIEFTTTRADGTGTAYAPRRIRISEDGRIFVTSLNTDGNYLWEVNPANMNEWTTVFQGTLNDNKELVDAEGNFVAAPNNGFDVKGAGENLQLAMYSVNLPGIIGAAMSGFRLHEYNLGTATTWATAPSKTIVDGLYAINSTGTQVEYDNEGGVWIASYRGTASDANPGLVHINADGVEDLKLVWNNVRQAGIRFNNDFTKLVVAGNNGAIKKATIYSISKDANGAPVLTEETVIDMAVVGNNLNDFAWDYAGNLYSCSNSAEKLAAWAMPYSGTVVTPAAAEYAFQIGEPVEQVEMVGVVKRAVQLGESTIVLTHETDSTPHIYNVIDGVVVAEISQEGVIARDPENAGDYLAISDIAVTEDGKLVATNYMQTQSTDDYVDAGYKRGETRIYIWNDLAGDPSILFTSKMFSNWFRSKHGLTMAVKGTSDNMEIFMTSIHATKAWARASSYRVIDGAYVEPEVNHNDHYFFYDINDAIALETTVGTQYELNASPLGEMNWVLDAELINPTEITEPETNNVEIFTSVTLTEDLGKKFNGATYVTVGEQVLMVAPYATSEGKLAGVELLDITNGFDAAQHVDQLFIDEAVEATAAATAVEVVEGDEATALLITLVADATIYSLEATLAKGTAYEIYEDEITNLVIDLDNLVLIGGPSSAFLVDVYLGLGEYNMSEDSYQLTSESAIAVMGSDATFIEGYAYEVDAFTPSAKAVLRCEWEDLKLEFHLTMTSAPTDSPTITYELNGGVTNDYGWMSKGDMFTACITDALGYDLGMTLDEFKRSNTPFDDLFPYFDIDHCQNILDNARWDWLEEYLIKVQKEDQLAATLTAGVASQDWRYAIAAFFFESQYDTSLDYTDAGKDEAYIPYWKHGYDNPTQTTREFTLNAPYKENHIFEGWYATPDFSSAVVKTINASTSGTLYAKWKERIEDVVSVKDLSYADAFYMEDDGATYWDFQLYNWDESGGSVLMPIVLLGVEAKSKTALNGTYDLLHALYGNTLDEETNGVDGVWNDETIAATLTIKNVDNENNYSFVGSFVGEDGKTYKINTVANVYAGDDTTGEVIELKEEGNSDPVTPPAPSTDGTIVFDADVDQGNATTDLNMAAEYIITKNGITMTVSAGVLGTFNNEMHYRVYKNQTLSLTSTVGNIVKIEFTCTANNDEEYGPGCFTVDGGDYTYTGTVGTWTGSASEITFSNASNQVRVIQVVVTIEGSTIPPTAITYELNGGVTNDYGWMSKNDMFQACMADAGVTGLLSLVELKEQADPFLPISTPFVTEKCQAILDNAKWDWLEAYIMNHQNADANAYPLTEGAASAGWRYAIAAFFLESQRTSWPVSADFSRAGTYEAFQPAWKYGFANPTEPTSDWVLNAPYKEGCTFAGWYTTPDFSGEKVKTVNAETTGTLYAKWIEYVPTIAEVKALADDTETQVAGIVTFIDGKNVYIQDVTGGILVYTAGTPDFNVGDKIIAKGVKLLYGGAPEVKNAIVESADASELPTAVSFENLTALIADTEFKYFATRVSVSDLKIVSYDSYNNPTVEDLLGNQALCYKMLLDPVVYPVGTKVNVTAVAAWYNGFQFVGDVSGIEKVVAAKDNYTYPVRNDKYALTNNWIFSNMEGNFADNRPGKTDYVRGMVVKDGIMYFINRETESLVRVDAATGTMLEPLKITGDHLFQVQGEDGTYKDAVTLKFNDLKFDNAGNCLIGGLMAGIKQHFMIYEVNLETGVATLLIDECLADNPAYADLSCRFDAFGVYGDVTKNAVVMAADESSWNVFRWQIKNGVVGKGELISILLDPEVDNYLASTATGFGTAPQIAPQDEEGFLFYVDGFNTLPMLFAGNLEDGAVLVDDFIHVPTGTRVTNNEGEEITMDTGHNGLIEFQVGDDYFLLMAASNTAASTPSAFALYKFADEMRTFDGLEPLWYFPHNGLGSATNGFRTAVPSVEVNGNTATISIYAVNNGYASYTLTLDDFDAPIRTEETATACDSYTWNGKTYTQSGTYTYTTTAVNGNDSIVTLHLTITPTLYTEETISACDSYVWNGQTFTEGGIYTYTTTSVAGCDSIVTLHLTIGHSEVGETEYATICYGENFTWNGQTYSTAGEYSITLSNTSGCDSIVTLQLTILPEIFTTEEYATICHGETYTWNGQSYATTGAYTTLLSSVFGCDSTAILHLTVLPEVIRKTEYISAPTNKTVNWRGKEYNETGTYYDTVHFVVNPLCDSVIYMLDLTIADNIDSDKYCGDNLTWYYSNGALIITGSGAMYDDPDRLTYRDESWYPARVNNIVLPEVITHIGNVAFADCANLTSIVIPSSVTSIGDGAFSWTGLQSVTIPASVTELGEQVFEACANLRTILYESEPRSINNQAIHPLIGCVHLDTIIAPAALWHCTTADPALEARYGVPHKARYIEVTDGFLTDQAIKYIANNNASVQILDLTNATNTTLPYGAWSNSYQLSTLYLPQQIEVIPESMVEGARNLSEIAIPATVTEIGNYAFSGCVNVWRMTVEAVIPPKVYENTFDGISRSISVQVPAGSEELYREAAYWREFFIEHTNTPSPISNCQKLLREDQILILRNGKVYTTMGQLVNTEE